jgi:hypothetical protein
MGCLIKSGGGSGSGWVAAAVAVQGCSGCGWVAVCRVSLERADQRGQNEPRMGGSGCVLAEIWDV